MKRWTGLFMWFFLVCVFFGAASESSIEQRIESAGTLFEDGTPIPVFRVTLTIKNPTSNDVSIGMIEKTAEYMRFVKQEQVGTSGDEDEKLLDPDRNVLKSFVTVTNGSITIKSLVQMPEEVTFSFYEAPKSKAAYQEMLEMSTAGIILNMLQVNGGNVKEETVNIKVPKLSLNLLTEDGLMDGTLKELSYELFYNEMAEERNQGNSFSLICAFDNQVPDYASVTVEPSDVKWTVENNTIRFEVPDQKMIRIRFKAVPDFSGEETVRVNAYAGALRDGIRKRVKYFHTYNEEATVYADILAVNAEDHGTRISGAEFEITMGGNPVNLSGQRRSVRTDENGFARLCGEEDDLSGDVSWSLDKDESYALKETKTPEGYLPLDRLVPVRIGNIANAAQGMVRSHETILIPYQEGVIWQPVGTYTLNGREMQEGENRLFFLVPSGASENEENVRLSSNQTAQTSAGNGEPFMFDRVIFLREGTYEFEIRQEDLSDRGIQHQIDHVLAKVEVLRNAETNLLEIQSVRYLSEIGGQQTEISGLSFTDKYLARGKYIVRGKITIDQERPAGEQLYAVMLQNGTEIARTDCDLDGEFSFQPIFFESSMEDHSFSIEIVPGELSEQQKKIGLKKPETKVILNLNTSDDGNGHMDVEVDNDQEIHFDYVREKNLHIQFRVHHKPAKLGDGVHQMNVILDGDRDMPAILRSAGKQAVISGKSDNGKTVYTFELADGDEIELSALPVGTRYRISMEDNDSRILTGFTWNGQSYATSSMEGKIGEVLPEYEVLMIYPDGTYLPSAKLVCLNRIEPERFPDFVLIPADERTEEAVAEGWIEIPENVYGKAQRSADGNWTVRMKDEAGQELGIRLHCIGEYLFRLVPLQAENSRFYVREGSGLLQLQADCDGIDVLQFTGECTDIPCYGMETLDLSISDIETNERFELAASFIHEAIQLENEPLRIIRNGKEERLNIQEDGVLLNVGWGDRITFCLPGGTSYSFDPVANEDSQMELVPEEGTSGGNLDEPGTCTLTICRKEATMELSVTQMTEKAASGEVQFHFFEDATGAGKQINPELRVLHNGASAVLQDGAIPVKDGDTISLTGRFAGLHCSVRTSDSDRLITQMSEDGTTYSECTELWTELRAGMPRMLSVVQTEAAFEISGVLELLGGALKKGMFEVVIEGEGQEKETIQCAESEDGKTVFRGQKRYLSSLGSTQLKVTTRLVRENPTVISDPAVFLVQISAKQGETGTVDVSQQITLQADGQTNGAEEIHFTGICLFPVQLSVRTIESEKTIPCRIVVTESGNRNQFAYTAGTRNGMILSGDTLPLCNEQAMIWLPYKAHYAIFPQLPSGYVLENETETNLAGYVLPDMEGMELVCSYKPAAVLDGQDDYRCPVHVEFTGGEWTDERFHFTLQPADKVTREAYNKGFRFSGGAQTLVYIAGCAQPEFDVAVVSGLDDAKGIEVLQGGEYRFTLVQTEKTAPGIRYDETVAEFILKAEDDGEGRLFPKLNRADENGPLRYSNEAQAALRVACEVTGKEETTYGLDSARQKELPVSVWIQGLTESAVTVVNEGNQAKTEQEFPVQEGRVELLLKHGETVSLVGLPVGATYRIEPDNSLSGYLPQETPKTGKLKYRQDNRATISLVYAPACELTVKGKVQLLYRQAVPGEKARFVLIPADAFTRERFETGYRLETEVSMDGRTAARRQYRMDKNAFSISSTVPAVSFAFEPIFFTQPGTYTFELYQISGNMANTVYDEAVYRVQIVVTDPDPGSGTFEVAYTILKDDAPAELMFANAYMANGEAVISGKMQLDGRSADPGEFTFVLLDESENQIARCTNHMDGTFVFPAISYGAADIGTVQYYRIRQLSGTAGGVTYDGQEYRAIVAIHDEGGGLLSTTVAILRKKDASQWAPSDGVSYSNRYQAEGTMEISGEIRMLGRPFLLGESIECQLFQKTDADEWTEIETRVLNPDEGNSITYSFDEIEYTLSDVEEAPFRYKISLKTNSEKVRFEDIDEYEFQVDLSDNGNGTLEIDSPPREKLSFSLMSLTEKTICCEFDDDNNASGLRPENLLVKLLADDKEIDRIRLSPDNDWQAATGLLPMADENGNAIHYRLEPERAKPYGLTLSEEMDKAVLVARYRPHFGKDDNVLAHLLAPATGDGNPLLRYLLVLGITGIVAAFIWCRRRK